MIHELKIWPVFFEAVLSGAKKWELRKNDRNYSVGDILYLQEWEPKTGQYTGRETRCEVIEVYTGVAGIADGYSILSLKRGSHSTTRPLVVPEGWLLVPLEPTPEMCTAGYAANEKWPSEHCDTQREWVYSVSQPRWAAMIKAAPKPPQT
jgi:hypothetical protein